MATGAEGLAEEDPRLLIEDLAAKLLEPDPSKFPECRRVCGAYPRGDFSPSRCAPIITWALLSRSLEDRLDQLLRGPEAGSPEALDLVLEGRDVAA